MFEWLLSFFFSDNESAQPAESIGYFQRQRSDVGILSAFAKELEEHNIKIEASELNTLTFIRNKMFRLKLMAAKDVNGQLRIINCAGRSFSTKVFQIAKFFFDFRLSLEKERLEIGDFAIEARESMFGEFSIATLAVSQT